MKHYQLSFCYAFCMYYILISCIYCLCTGRNCLKCGVLRSKPQNTKPSKLNSSVNYRPCSRTHRKVSQNHIFLNFAMFNHLVRRHISVHNSFHTKIHVHLFVYTVFSSTACLCSRAICLCSRTVHFAVLQKCFLVLNCFSVLRKCLSKFQGSIAEHHTNRAPNCSLC